MIDLSRTFLQLIKVCRNTRITLDNFVNFQSLRNPEVAPNGIIYAQPKVYRSQRVAEERDSVESIRNRDNLSPITKPHHEMYLMRYACPINIAKAEGIDAENEDEDEDDEEYRDNQDDEGSNTVTRF